MEQIASTCVSVRFWIDSGLCQIPSAHSSTAGGGDMTETGYLPETASPTGSGGAQTGRETPNGGKERERKWLEDSCVHCNIIRGHQETVLKAILDTKKLK